MKLMQISNQYMQPILFLRLLPNRNRENMALANKKVKSWWSDSPYELWLQNNLQNGFLVNIDWTTEAVHTWNVAI